MADRTEIGMTTRRAVLGDAHVDRAEAAKTELDAPFQSLITEAAWGTVWASDKISRRERSMLTLALLAATGNFEEIPMHIAPPNFPVSSNVLRNRLMGQKEEPIATKTKTFQGV